MSMFQSCSTKEYDDNLKIAFGTMEDVFNEGNKVSQTMKKVVETYFSNINKYYDNEDALAEMAHEQYDAFEKEGVGKRISDNVELLRSQSASLKNPPSSRVECYNEFMEIASGVCQFCEKINQNLSMRPDNPVDFSHVYPSADMISRMMSDFKLKYADILYPKDN